MVRTALLVAVGLLVGAVPAWPESSSAPENTAAVAATTYAAGAHSVGLTLRLGYPM